MCVVDPRVAPPFLPKSSLANRGAVDHVFRLLALCPEVFWQTRAGHRRGARRMAWNEPRSGKSRLTRRVLDNRWSIAVVLRHEDFARHRSRWFPVEGKGERTDHFVRPRSKGLWYI